MTDKWIGRGVAFMIFGFGALLFVFVAEFGVMLYDDITGASVQSKCVEQTKARIYEWDGTTQMMYDENC